MHVPATNSTKLAWSGSFLMPHRASRSNHAFDVFTFPTAIFSRPCSANSDYAFARGLARTQRQSPKERVPSTKTEVKTLGSPVEIQTAERAATSLAQTCQGKPLAETRYSGSESHRRSIISQDNQDIGPHGTTSIKIHRDKHAETQKSPKIA